MVGDYFDASNPALLIRLCRLLVTDFIPVDTSIVLAFAIQTPWALPLDVSYLVAIIALAFLIPGSLLLRLLLFQSISFLSVSVLLLLPKFFFALTSAPSLFHLASWRGPWDSPQLQQSSTCSGSSET